MHPNLMQGNHSAGRIRIAPASSAMISSAGVRSRDPRLLRMRPHVEMPLQLTTPPPSLPMLPTGIMLMGNSSGITKSLPRIPKYSSANIGNGNKISRDHDERDPRKRREKEPKSDSMPKDKIKSSKSSSSLSGERKKSSSSQDSPRKRSDEDKKSSKSGSSQHKSSTSTHSRSRSGKSPNKSPRHSSKPLEDIDLRTLQSAPTALDEMRPDSTTANSKYKNKLLSELLNDEDIKSSQDMMITTSNNGKKHKPILLVMINVHYLL